MDYVRKVIKERLEVMSEDKECLQKEYDSLAVRQKGVECKIKEVKKKEGELRRFLNDSEGLKEEPERCDAVDGLVYALRAMQSLEWEKQYESFVKHTEDAFGAYAEKKLEEFERVNASPMTWYCMRCGEERKIRANQDGARCNKCRGLIAPRKKIKLQNNENQ